MTRNVQLALQVIAVLIQFMLPAWPDIDPKWLNFGHAAVAGIQGVVALIGHAYNPDGTSAQLPYVKDSNSVNENVEHEKHL